MIADLALVVLGLSLGSFVNALVWRVHQQAKSKNKKKAKDYSILNGRSMCPHCRHELATKDLIPLFSWLLLKGKCRYCKKPISVQYPLVEVAMAAVFILSFIFWPGDLTQNGQIVLFATWLAVSVGLMALLVYDAKWMLLPNRILMPTLVIAAVGRLGYIFFYETDIWEALLKLALSLAIASGIFWALFHLSKGKLIGYGDVRLGYITGMILARPSLSLLMIFTASVLGTLAAIPGLLKGNKTVMSKIPFGPFLIAGTWLVLLFGQSVVEWYTNLL